MPCCHRFFHIDKNLILKLLPMEDVNKETGYLLLSILIMKLIRPDTFDLEIK